MHRREFLIQLSGTLAVPVVLHASGCGGGDSSPPADAGSSDAGSADADTTSDASSADAGGSAVAGTGSGSGHSHTVCGQLTAGQAASFTSSFDSDHDHTVMITADQMDMLASGQTVQIQTSDAGHPHTWMVTRADACS